MRSSIAQPASTATAGEAAPAPAAESPFRGIALLLASVFFFACADAASKELMEVLPAIQVTWLRYLAFVVLLVPAVLTTGTRALHSRTPVLQVLRGLGVAVSGLLFILGLGYLPLAETTAIAFVSPLLVIALSVPFLGERVGFRRWAATLVGLGGVLVVVRPGTEAFALAALLPLAAAFIWASSLIITRHMGEGEHPVATLVYTAWIGFLLLSAVVPFAWAELGLREWLVGGLSGLAATIAQWLVMLAYRRGSPPILAPFTYSQLVWAALLGFIVFGAVPDGATVLGAAIIIGSGVYIAHRERVRTAR